MLATRMPLKASAPIASIEVLHCRRTGESDPVGPSRDGFMRALRKFGRRHRSIRFHHIHVRAAAGEFARQDVASDRSPRDQHTGALQIVSRKRGQQSFRDILFRHHIHFDMEALQSIARGRSDRADASSYRTKIRTARIEALKKIADPIGAGENQPIVTFAVSRWPHRAEHNRRPARSGSSAVRSPPHPDHAEDRPTR